MKHISKKAWFTLTFAIVALSAVFAVKKPMQKKQASHVVVDRLVNQLVCSADNHRSNRNRFPRGILSFNIQKFAAIFGDSKRDKRRSDDVTLLSPHKVVLKNKQYRRVEGPRPGERRPPVGGDITP